jgi:hypothetical protein
MPNNDFGRSIQFSITLFDGRRAFVELASLRRPQAVQQAVRKSE